MIILQIIRIKATFSERTIRSNKAARQLKNFNGFDKEPNKLFDPDEIAKKNFLGGPEKFSFNLRVVTRSLQIGRTF